MRSLLCVLLVIFMLTPRLSAQTSSLEQDSLATTGLIKPNDMLHRMSGWDRATTDGFTYRLNAGYYGFYGPQPSVYLDDIPINFSFFNWQNLNLLPTSMDFVDQLTYNANPGVYNQALATGGMINLHTAQADSGFSVYGSLSLGNLVEDPGPWAFDSTKVTPNINRQGPHYFTRVAYRGSRWHANIQASLRQHQPTNLNNRGRIASYSYDGGDTFYHVKNTLGNGMAEVGYDTENWHVTGRGIYDHNREYLFYQPFGREVPTTSKYAQWALQAKRQLGSWMIKGRYLGEQKKLDYRPNNKDYNFDWHRQDHNLSFEAEYVQDHWKATGGAIIGLTSTTGTQLKDNQATATLYASSRIQFNDRHSAGLKASIDVAEFDKTAPTLAIDTKHKINDYWTLGMEARYIESLYYRQQSSTFWVKQGYALFSELGIKNNKPFSSKQNKTTVAKLNNEVRLNQTTSISLEAVYKRHINLNIPWQVVSYEPPRTYTKPHNFDYTGQKGSRFNASLRFNQQLARIVSHELGGYLQKTVAGSSRYYSYWKQVPQYRLNYQFNIRPASDLSFSLTALYRGAAKWKEYKNLDGKQYRSIQSQYPYQYGTFHSRTPSFFNLNLTADKWFWDHRLKTTFSVRNLLNTELRYHTLGFDKSLKFIIKVSLSL